MRNGVKVHKTDASTGKKPIYKYILCTPVEKDLHSVTWKLEGKKHVFQMPLQTFLEMGNFRRRFLEHVCMLI